MFRQSYVTEAENESDGRYVWKNRGQRNHDRSTFSDLVDNFVKFAACFRLDDAWVSCTIVVDVRYVVIYDQRWQPCCFSGNKFQERKSGRDK